MGDVQFVPLPWPATLLPSPAKLGLELATPKLRQLGGRRLGLEVLHDFLNDRSAQYRGGISSPLLAPTACSRLSPYLALGCVSLREVVQSTYHAVNALPAGNWQKKGLVAFVSRLYWHCHFIQKLESEPELEYQNLHRGYDGLRENDWNPAHFEALTTARTGWPLVDACVVMLRETGWLNFRMRAMLVSVAAYPLWLHWRPVGQWLARQFLDYEPGIHWSQMQMQSGTTGINTTRVYNPIKQAQDHDPHGHFVRRWLPYMRRVPDMWLFEPWRMPLELQERLNLAVGVGAEFDIPEPVVDLQTATREAKAKLH
jgi:deoxyribodipyrimidine photo-lyase